MLDEMKALPAADANAFGTHFALAASPARYMIERGDWAGALCPGAVRRVPAFSEEADVA